MYPDSIFRSQRLREGSPARGFSMCNSGVSEEIVLWRSPAQVCAKPPFVDGPGVIRQLSITVPPPAVRTGHPARAGQGLRVLSRTDGSLQVDPGWGVGARAGYPPPAKPALKECVDRAGPLRAAFLESSAVVLSAVRTLGHRGGLNKHRCLGGTRTSYIRALRGEQAQHWCF